MNYLWATLLILLNGAWLLLVVLGLPGNWLKVISTAAIVWWQWGNAERGGVEMFSIWTLVAIIVIAVAAELAEFFTGVFGAAKAGATKRGSFGAIVGGIVGAIAATFLIPIPILGSILGACVGAGLGAWGFEMAGGRKFSESAKSGVGAGVGTLAGRVVKIVSGVVIWLVIAVAAFWP